jgi:hypothetical protein
MIGENKTDDDICKSLKINRATLTKAKKDILEKDKAIFEKLDSGIVYSDYLIKSKSMIKRLQRMSKKFGYRNQYTALVAAIKAEKDIYDSCIKLGQEFGFIDKKTGSLALSAEIDMNDLSDDEVRDEIETEVKRLNKLVSGNVVDVRPELAAIAGDDVNDFMPTNVVKLPKKEKRKAKVKAKLTLTRR